MNYHLAITLSLAMSFFLSVKSNEASTYIAFIHNFFEDHQTIKATVTGNRPPSLVPYEIEYRKYEVVTINTEKPGFMNRPPKVDCFINWYSEIHHGIRFGYFNLFDASKNIPAPEDTVRDKTGAFVYFLYLNKTGAYTYTLDGKKKLKARWG